MSDKEITVLWLRPSTGENVSVRRERIAEHLEKKNVQVTICDTSGLDAFGAISEVLSTEYDVIIGNVRIGLYLGYALSIALRKPLIGDVSDSIEDLNHLPAPVYGSIRAFEWWVLARSQTCFFVEADSYETAKDRGLHPILARNAVDYDRFRYPSSKSKDQAHKALKEGGVALDNPIAIYIGSMVPHYYLSEIGDAAERTPGWEFVFIGKDRGAGIQEIVSERENAHFLGSFEYDLIPGFLYHGSAGLCLADREQPLKIMEYGAAGLPTLGYNGKLRKNFSDDELVFVDADPAEISDVLRRLSSDNKLASMYGENLQQKAKEHSWKAVAEQYYEQIVKATEH
ncbi:glycosyltransferase family protein [Halobellus litoreus]|uniref:Glycosyltransferase n=1 Tax=Halobellus litoreus TaxID=755310 RepID=A0ABD6DUL5_9EURY|nr:glycosyltransferase [Halobellus litoreus]